MNIETSPSTEPIGSVPVPTPGRGLDTDPTRPTAEEAAAINLPIERATIYEARGEVFQKDGDKDGVEFSDAEIGRMADGRLTHNHPNGNSFSDKDLAFAVGADLAEMRIVCGTADNGAVLFRLERPKSGWTFVSRQMLAIYEDAAEVVRDRQMRRKAKDGISGRKARRTFTHEVMELLHEIFPELILYTRIDL